MLTVQAGPALPWCRLSYSLIRDAGGARATGAAAPAAADRPYSPSVWDSGPAEVRPVLAATLGGPGHMAELPLIHLDPEAAAPEARPRGAEGFAEAEPAPTQLTWEEHVAQEEAEVFTLRPWGTEVEEMG